ncbi:hypothetical protein E2C01_064140 [Portunus trituberculatus]|uniref:Uncharacterized protein n=1 Tax=Portunus trituberculatus TaxID=210409 RepID=A0A5B7HKX6_PORTR|nr:hypothetical protein [Portunus trituberculatus]
MNHLVFSAVPRDPEMAWGEARHSNPLDKHCLLCLPKLHLDWSGSWRAAGLSKHRSCLFTARRVPALATATASWARLLAARSRFAVVVVATPTLAVKYLSHSYQPRDWTLALSVDRAGKRSRNTDTS